MYVYSLVYPWHCLSIEQPIHIISQDSLSRSIPEEKIIVKGKYKIIA